MMEENIQKEVTDKYSLRGRVYNQLREDILTGKYHTGDELKECAIGDEYGVSRTPVRDAFHQLELEGLITIVPNKGAVVDGITARDVVDIYEIRSRLEGLAARWACENVTRDQLDRIEENLYMSDYQEAKGHYEKVTELDSQFHELMYEASGSKRLEIILKEMHQYVYSIRKMSIAAADRGRISNEEHRSIADAIKESRPDDADELAHNHIMNALKNALNNGLSTMLEDQDRKENE